MPEQENNRSREENAFMLLNEDLTIKKFDMERARQFAADPNPHISGTAGAMVQLLDAAVEVVLSSPTKEEAASRIQNLKIEDGAVAS